MFQFTKYRRISALIVALMLGASEANALHRQLRLDTCEIYSIGGDWVEDDIDPDVLRLMGYFSVHQCSIEIPGFTGILDQDLIQFSQVACPTGQRFELIADNRRRECYDDNYPPCEIAYYCCPITENVNSESQVAAPLRPD